MIEMLNSMDPFLDVIYSKSGCDHLERSPTLPGSPYVLRMATTRYFWVESKKSGFWITTITIGSPRSTLKWDFGNPCLVVPLQPYASHRITHLQTHKTPAGISRLSNSRPTWNGIMPCLLLEATYGWVSGYTPGKNPTSQNTSLHIAKGRHPLNQPCLQ